MQSGLMNGFARRVVPLLFALLLGLPAMLFAQPMPTQPTAHDLMRHDAELTDVTFVNAQTGWAVGDRGVIWHTENGGRTWQLQESNVRCRLNSITFLDQHHGWAAGGWTQAMTHVPRGMVLRTRDGGRTWQAERNLLVPTLHHIKFFDTKQGVALGKPSAMFPSGVFTTSDGGATWSPAPAETGQAWLAGDFIDSATGALAGHSGTIATVRRGTVNVKATVDFGLRGLRRMKLQSPQHGWLVGDGGLVLTTGDLGQSWQTTAGRLPNGAEPHFDLAALAVLGEQCWVAGSPGTRVFHTADGGRTWTAAATGNTTPITALAFADPMHGWAVGSLGNILATSDGGRTWIRQRSGGTRAAILGFYGDADRVPLEVFARLSAGEGYLAHVRFVTRGNLDDPAGAATDLPGRAHEALVEAGACGAETAWRFPAPQAGLSLPAEQLVAALDAATDGAGLAQLELDLVRQLRTWRPELVFTHHVSPRGEYPLGHLINQLVLRAVEKAADSTSHVELASSAGLEPWQAKKIYATLDPGQGGTTTIDTTRLDPRLGQSVADVAATARGLIADEYRPVPLELGFRLLINHLPQDRGREDFFSGLALSPGSDARRLLSEPSPASMNDLRRAAQLRRNMQELLKSAEKMPKIGETWLGQVGDLTRGLDSGAACQMLAQLAANYQRSGRWELAADTLQAMIERHPNHPLAQSAHVWLLQYYASGEASWRLRRGGNATVLQTGATVADAPASAVVPADGRSAIPALRETSQGVEAGRTLDPRSERAAEIGKLLERTQPMLFAEPHVRFPLAAAHRAQGFGGQADRFFLQLRRTRVHDAWWAAAQGEHWLTSGSDEPPKSLWHVRPATARPRLDGRLDDAIWQAGRPIDLQSKQTDDSSWPARAMLAYDREYLYFAAVCRKGPGVTYATTDAIRSRDADLAAHDRLELLIDLDRDYVTYYKLAIDHRGWTHDACWGDATWNPTWYVAQAADEETWTVEVAIPWADLTGRPPEAGHVWAAGLQRTIPGLGFQSWTTPASPQVIPAGFGYLKFH